MVFILTFLTPLIIIIQLAVQQHYLAIGTTYNPVNYQVTFDNTKVQNIFWGNNIDIGYLNGSAGL